jgi:seryl-tRNA synthetase
MLDLKFVRENPEIVKQNMRNKFQDHKLGLVDEVIALDAENRRIISEANDLRAEKNRLSKQIGMLMAQKKIEEANETKQKVAESAKRLAELEALEPEFEEKIKKMSEPKKGQEDQGQDLPDEYFKVLEIVGKYFENNISLKRSSAGKGSMTIHFNSDEEVRKFLKAIERCTEE